MQSRHARNEASVLSFARERLFDGVHMAKVALRRGENSLFHLHTATRDTFFVMSGQLVIDVRVSGRDPSTCYRSVYAASAEVTPAAGGDANVHRIRVRPGELLVIEPGVVHCAMNLDEAACHFLCIEGIGEYNFIEV